MASLHGRAYAEVHIIRVLRITSGVGGPTRLSDFWRDR